MMKRAVFPGTFDPITNGHVGVIRKALKIFDEVIVAIGVNAKKTHLFPVDQRANWIKQTFKDEPKVIVKTYSGLTVNFCKNEKAEFIIRGLRNSADFEYEQSIAQANKLMNEEIETIFLLAPLEFATISSSIVREIILSEGDFKRFVPEAVLV